MTSFNVTANIIANMMGIVLLIVLLIGNGWRINIGGKPAENRCLLVLVITVFISCVLDPVSSVLDGMHGEGPAVLLYMTNAWLYGMNPITSIAWLLLLMNRLDVRVTMTHKVVFSVSSGIAIAILLLNPFTNWVFYIDMMNVYHRGPLYWFYLAFDLCYIAYSVIVHRRATYHALRFFPIAVFLLPVMVGIVIQTMFYGISVIWPCVAIAAGGVMASLQSETIFRDKLTGMGNRYYLDYQKKRYEKYSATGKLYVMMLDLNDFKAINDRWGHAEGDQALITTANLIRAGVGTEGVAIRYAGDEFIVLMPDVDEDKTEACIQRIRDAMTEYNAISGKPYRLSIAAGVFQADLSKMTVEHILNEVDRRMYSDKKLYYQIHDRRARQ